MPVRLVNLILLLIASVFFVWILNEVGWDTLGHYLWQVGWYWPLLLLPYGVVNWLEAWSWKYILVDPPGDHGGPPLLAASRGGSLKPPHSHRQPGGRALQGLPPPGRRRASGGGQRLGGDHEGHPGPEPGPVYFSGAGPGPVSPGQRPHTAVLLLAALGLARGMLFVVVQGGGPCNSFRFLDRCGWLPHFLKDQEGLQSLDTHVPFYRQYPARALLSLACFS